MFVDNLNPKVDLECMWGIFKPFGKVRDVFLSAEKASRRSKYAFLRFESLEEVTKVAKTTNGMHVYSWPISAKVAEQDWKNRMVRKEKQSFSFKRENRRSPKEGVRFRDEFVRKGYGVGEKDATRSFVEAVRGKQKVEYSVNVEEKENMKEKMKSMFWDSSQNDREWIKKCAKGRNSRKEPGNIQIYGTKGVGEMESRSQSQVGKESREFQKIWQDIKPEVSGRGKVIGQSKQARKTRGVVMKRSVNKGKKMWCKRVKVRPKSSMVQNGKLVLEKRKVSDVTEGVRDTETSSSSEEVLRGERFPESCREIGECSKKVDLNGATDGNGPNEGSKPNNVSFRVASKGPNGLEATETDQRMDFCVDLGQVIVGNIEGRRVGNWVPEVEAFDREHETVSDSMASVEEIVRDTFEVENQGKREGVAAIELREEVEEGMSNDNQIFKDELVRTTIEMEMVVGSTVADSEEELMSHGRRTERESAKVGARFRRNNQDKSVRRHGMLTRNSINRQNGQMERSLDPAEEEAIRVMEIRDVIGFDFSCEEEEVLNEIARREKEDNDKGRSKAG
ncbi:hypothetical protein LWI29_017381 [Acer saccharum]|uniref:RRM domain-containing protein n=1 Tax=Acer saccharum TaxID=4024 RepID=A0AA39W6I5_ACESA|nr:hypothetical protein LWI29_017381 [Acer saccharum]